MHAHDVGAHTNNALSVALLRVVIGGLRGRFVARSEQIEFDDDVVLDAHEAAREGERRYPEIARVDDGASVIVLRRAVEIEYELLRDTMELQRAGRALLTRSRLGDVRGREVHLRVGGHVEHARPPQRLLDVAAHPL